MLFLGMILLTNNFDPEYIMCATMMSHKVKVLKAINVYFNRY